MTILSYNSALKINLKAIIKRGVATDEASQVFRGGRILLEGEVLQNQLCMKDNMLLSYFTSKMNKG